MKRWLLAALATLAFSTEGRAAEQAVADAPTREEAGGYVRLDIAERRITEGPYTVSLAVTIADQRGIDVRIGAFLRAARIDVLLRNVKGRYLFRADLRDLRQGGSTPPQP